MKTIAYFFILPLFLFSCNTQFEKEYVEEESTLPEVSSYRFLEFKKKPNFETIEIDSLQNFGAVIKNMERLTCEGKYFGLKLTDNDTIYQLTGYSGCPDDVGIIGCYFRVNHIYIKNDSLRRLTNDSDTMVSIKKLAAELEIIIANEFNFKWDKNVLKPAIISLYIDDKYPISKTKEVLKEITKVFNEINSEHGEDYFRYTILFKNYSWLDIPPPPPPEPY